MRDIEGALALPTCGRRSDFDLAPELKAAASAGTLKPPRPASVLCALVERPRGLTVVLTVRARHLKHHPGQISFPGGKVDAEDKTALDTALREAEEEIGLARDGVELLGALDPYLTSTNFTVAPFVARVRPGWVARIDPSEVDEVFECPLDFLMDPANRRRDHREWQGIRRHFYAMPWGRYYIWGATAGMLKILSDRLIRLGAVDPAPERGGLALEEARKHVAAGIGHDAA
ncbi:MAG: CoA pyrophosphatase [Pseudomonadota bacterium]